MKVKAYVLVIIVIAQFFCTSLWFAGNSVMHQLIVDFDLSEQAIGHLTSAVQFGFIIGTLVFAIFTIVDRFSPSRVFFCCAIAGALSNLGMTWDGGSSSSLLLSRFLTGFFLAGIYPVGMKIATDYFKEGLGKSMGYLVAALVFGTALPHLFRGAMDSISWKSVLYSTSILAIIGGFLVLLLVKNGPYRTPSQKLNFSTFFKVFKNKKFRSAAFGYFGHMWELYAFWTFVPLILIRFNRQNSAGLNVPIWCFAIIGIGGIGCMLAGAFAQKKGTQKVASLALLCSGICCLLSPLLFFVKSSVLFLGFLLFWGLTVVADSPLFSTLVAQNAEPKVKGTALIIVTCIGFSITILSIELLTYLSHHFTIYSLLMILGIGPVFGLMSVRKSIPNTPQTFYSALKEN